LERDIVLSQIDNSFIWVPLEFHAEAFVANDSSSLADYQTIKLLKKDKLR